MTPQPSRPIRARAKLLDLFCELPHHLGESRPFRGGYPLQPESLRLYAKIFKHEPYGISSLFCLEVPFLVMAIARVASADEHSVCSFRQGVDD